MTAANAVTGAYFASDTITLRYGDDVLHTYDLTPAFVAELARALEPAEWLLIQRAANAPRTWAEVESAR